MQIFEFYFVVDLEAETLKLLHFRCRFETRSHWDFFSRIRDLVLWRAEIRLRPAVIILWGGIEVTVMMVVVVLRGGVVVVMVVVGIVDICVREEQGGRGGWRVLGGGGDACRQGAVALDGTVPTRRAHLRSAGAGQQSWDIPTNLTPVLPESQAFNPNYKGLLNERVPTWSDRSCYCFWTDRRHCHNVEDCRRNRLWSWSCGCWSSPQGPVGFQT